jgi:transcription-repair coupling factor (superfamily II helicase)
MRSIQKLVPFAKVTFAHGKMGKKELEERMIDFINHEYDVLVSTTIIETGIDIPNANTLIIFDADKFGLSQLYQIRGRVGRSDRIAYSYLMYQPKKVLTELAAKRLKAIKDFTQLGSGFKIAMRDLGIRGAGDILGSEQAGFIDTVGIEMYTRMLESEVKVLKGIPIDEEETPAVLNITTHIPDQYLDSSDLKIEVHQKVNEINNMNEYHLLYDELSDRFGEVPEDVDQMMKEVLLKRYMGFFHASNLKITKNSVSVDFDFELFSKLHGEKFLEIAMNTSRFIRFSQQKKHLQIIVDTIKIKENWLSVLLTFFDAIEKELKGVK